MNVSTKIPWEFSGAYCNTSIDRATIPPQLFLWKDQEIKRLPSHASRVTFFHYGAVGATSLFQMKQSLVYSIKPYLVVHVPWLQLCLITVPKALQYQKDKILPCNKRIYNMKFTVSVNRQANSCVPDLLDSEMGSSKLQNFRLWPWELNLQILPLLNTQFMSLFMMMGWLGSEKWNSWEILHFSV